MVFTVSGSCEMWAALSVSLLCLYVTRSMNPETPIYSVSDTFHSRPRVRRGLGQLICSRWLHAIDHTRMSYCDLRNAEIVDIRRLQEQAASSMIINLYHSQIAFRLVGIMVLHLRSTSVAILGAYHPFCHYVVFGTRVVRFSCSEIIAGRLVA